MTPENAALEGRIKPKKHVVFLCKMPGIVHTALRLLVLQIKIGLYNTFDVAHKIIRSIEAIEEAINNLPSL